MTTTDDFSGAKVALFIGGKLLITLRDDFDHIPFPNLWDFPGGARDPGETEDETLAREVMEEVGLTIPPEAFVWKRRYPANHMPGEFVWFYVAKMPEGTQADIVFGDEGQGWRLVTLDAFLTMENVVPSFPGRLRDWMKTTRQ